MDFSQTCVITSPMHALLVILFSAGNKHLNVFERLMQERLLHCRLIVAMGPPTNDLHKLLDTQFILMYHFVVKVKKL